MSAEEEDIWDDIYAEACEIIDDSDILFFRGHADASWDLVPGLGRNKKIDINTIEPISYYDFVTKAGSLLPEKNSSWNNIFAMQHHGMPTRLLDWTESFSVALYFAMKGAKDNACVWILDPFELNQLAINNNSILFVSDLDGDYEEYFLSEKKKFDGEAIAISPLRHHPRVFGQKGGFTLHGNLTDSLETLYPDSIRKIEIPREAHGSARRYLRIAGISEFSLFPDLDGLSRELKQQHFGKK